MSPANNENSMERRTFNQTTEGLPIVAMEQLAAWCSVFGATGFAIVLSNTLFLAAFRRISAFRKRRTHLLVSLACADEIVGLVAVPAFTGLLFLSHSTGRRPQLVLEEAYITIDLISGLASVFTLTSIAIERLYAVAWPLNYRGMRRGSYAWLIATPWILSCILSLVRIMTTLSTFKYLQPPFYTYSLVALTSISLATIITSYIGVWIKLRSHNRSLKLTSSVNRRRKSEREKALAVALLIVTVLFVIAWLPLHTLNIIVNFDQSVIKNLPIEAIFLAKLLQYCNSFLNIIVYSSKIPDVRTGIKKVLRWKRNQEIETRL